MKRFYSYIYRDERRKIARWRTAGLIVDAIAEQLGRYRSTIFREIKRNTFVDKVVCALPGHHSVEMVSDGLVDRNAPIIELHHTPLPG